MAVIAFHGVYFNKVSDTYQVRVFVSGKSHSFGYAASQESAAHLRDDAFYHLRPDKHDTLSEYNDPERASHFSVSPPNISRSVQQYLTRAKQTQLYANPADPFQSTPHGQSILRLNQLQLAAKRQLADLAELGVAIRASVPEQFKSHPLVA